MITTFEITVRVDVEADSAEEAKIALFGTEDEYESELLDHLYSTLDGNWCVEDFLVEIGVGGTAR